MPDCSIVIGVFGIRLNIVIPALAVPVFRGFDHAIDSPRLSSLYIPNWVEWVSSLGIVAATALLYLRGHAVAADDRASAVLRQKA